MPPAPRRAYVRLDALLATHPLRADLGRLDAAERRLAEASGTLTVGKGGEAGRVSGYDIPALARKDGDAVETALQSIDDRHGVQRQRLVRSVQRSLEDFELVQIDRRERLIDQERAQQTAAKEARDAQKERRKRGEVEAEIGRKIEAFTDEKIVILSRLGILEAQLDLGSVFLPPVLEPDKLEEHIQTLRKDPKATGIGPRARLELQRRNETARLQEIDSEIAAATEAGRAEILRFIAAAEKARAAEVDSELNKLRDQNAFKLVTSKQTSTLAQLVRAEDAVTSSALEAAATAVPAAGAASGQVRLETLFGSATGGTSAALALTNARERLMRQRRSLEGFLRASVTEGVRDAAQTRHIDVKIVGDTAAGTAVEKDRVDMTSAFAEWIKPAAGLPAATMQKGGGGA